ncbi:methyltransferase [Bacteroides phage BT638P2]|nr:methyltransferase [Bacteroides phage BT638P2]
MNVLSLFDGMSCGQIALNELGMFPDKYYACEIDKFAIAQTKLNFPDTICLGDVTKLDVSKLEKIDLLIGGSPCQSFSFAGKMEGMTTEDNEEITTLDRYLELKEKGFKFAGQSYLFWEYVRILKEVRKVNPNVLFLLENVRMLSKWEDVINRTLGVKGVHINSSLVSAQIRKRIYWTNIADIPQPEDKGIFLRDVLQSEVPEKYYISDKMHTWLTRHAAKMGSKILIRGRGEDKSNCISVSCLTKTNLASCYIEGPKGRLRRITPTEASRLQTVPDWYKWGCSDTQQYKMLGNGWTVAVIYHIFSFIK